MATPDAGFVVDFPTLWIVPEWIEAHCPIPDGFHQGEPLVLYPWQLWATVNHYRVRPSATVGQLATAFHYRRSQVVMPQKTGKGPWAATIVCAEAVGPVVFAGWARGGERYRCIDHGCDCGWWYEYEPGEPMGMPWRTPLIQLLATSEQQVENVYRPLRGMITAGPLSRLMRVGENFIRIGSGDGRIDPVTSSATSRLGNPITFAVQDETGIYTATNKMIKVAETMRRGLAGMGGRAIETSNAWDPSEDSTARRTYEAKASDVFRYFPQAPATLSFGNKAERRRILTRVYAGSSHVDLDAIEAEAAELMERDPAQAERFYGNRLVSGSDAWLPPSAWAKRGPREGESPREVPPGTRVVLGFDGSDVDDWTGIRAETQDGYQFTPTYGPTNRPTVWDPADFGGQVPRLEVDAAVEELFRRYDVVRMYCDPPYWETEVDAWAERYGEKRVIRWPTYRAAAMHAAMERLKTDVTKRDSSFSHDGCPFTSAHIGHARAAARPGGRYVLTKPSSTQKIDLAVVSVLTHEAAGDVTAAGAWRGRRPNYIYTPSTTRWAAG